MCALEATRDVEERLVWFYQEVCRLDPVANTDDAKTGLRFKSALVEIRFEVVDAPPPVDSVPLRVTIAVPSLAEAMGLLDEARVPYTLLRGVYHTDTRVEVLDAMGHRVALKQEWASL